MNDEKIINPPSGFFAFFLFLAILAGAILSMVEMEIVIGIVLFVINFILVLPGLVVVNPNESKVLTLFGSYVGTVKKDGFFWVNPFTTKKKISLRAFNLNGQQLKVNDSVGNPIEIAAVIIWQIKDTARAAFAVEAVSVIATNFETPLGPHNPYHETMSNPGIPDSSTLGTSGMKETRFALVTARGFNRPDFTRG